MEKIKCRKSDLLDVMRKNRSEHRAIFLEAQAGFRAKAIKILDQAIERAKLGQKESLFVSLNAPEDHTSDYNRVIKMLEMAVDDEIMLSEAEFTKYVQDEWSWQRGYLASNSGYSPTATTKLAQMD